MRELARLTRAPDGTRIADGPYMQDQRPYSELMLCGDWAIAHGNIESLAVIADELAHRAHGGLRAELLEIRELCKSDDGFAACRWYKLRPRMAEDTAFVDQIER